MRSVDDHLALALATVRVVRAIDLALPDALDCVLAAPTESAVSLPGFDNSSMDGYAVVAADLTGASDAAPVVLPVVGDLPAGVREVPAMSQGSAVRIMTGAPLPRGADAVVPVEWTDAGTVRVGITRAPTLGQNIRRVGEDVVAGQALVAAGTRLTARHLGLLAATGHDRVRVHPRPRVVVMSTGSELVQPGRALRDGQIFESNSYAARGRRHRHRRPRVPGAAGRRRRPRPSSTPSRTRRCGPTRSSPPAGSARARTTPSRRCCRGSAPCRFEKVAMQPGMPQGLGRVGDRVHDDGVAGVPIFTLPGNPVSAYVSFEVFVRPALRKMMGESSLHRPLVRATATRGWTSPPGKRQFTRVVVEGAVGGFSVTPVGGHGSHLVNDLSVANGLAVVPEEVTEVAAGDIVRCMLLERGRR